MDKKYDLNDRLLIFAKRCRELIKKMPKTITNHTYADQLARSSSSPGANYIEANESLSKKDFCMRIKICRKEAKESNYWLNLLETGHDQEVGNELEFLKQESIELVKIFSAILVKST